MSWCRDECSFEFSSSLPLSSSLHMSMSVSPGPSLPPLSSSPCAPGFGNRDIPSLERDFCSNFACCGLRLADLHELLEHFEESHVMVIAADGTPIYPRTKPHLPSSPYAASSTSSSSSPASSDIHFHASSPDAPYSSLVYNYPQPHPSPPPSWSPLPAPGRYGKERDGPEDDEVDVMDNFDSFDTDSLYPCHPPGGLGLPPSSFTVPTRVHGSTAPPGDPPPSSREPRPPTSGLSTKALSRNLATRRREASQVPTRGQKHAHARKRDKMFKCPRAGCSKSYLNPNGLKYHVEKGTCKIESKPNNLETHLVTRGE